MSVIKLSSIKADARFTTNQQIYRLTQPHHIAKLHIKIGDIRKNKMVSSLTLFYTERTSVSIVDLKMHGKQVWCKAKRVRVEPVQQEVKLELALPIVASSLMIEYSGFYEPRTPPAPPTCCSVRAARRA